MDLTPRTGGTATAEPGATPAATPAAGRGRRSRKTLGAGLVLAVVLALGAVFLWQGLSNATLYFCNADEVGVRDQCSGDQRFRLQGTVVQDSISTVGGTTDFEVAHGAVTIPVRHVGEPGGIFQAGIPVVVEGRMQGTTFESDRILVKHTEQYREENPDRVPEGAP